MARFTLMSTPLSGLTLIERQPIEDARGFFERLFCAEELQAAGFTSPIAQINHTRTWQSGVVRGMHFQHAPFAEAKVVSCLKGEVFDVAVDLRLGSPTFLHWHSEVLSAKNCRSLVISKGYAHGFQTLCENCELIYMHSAPYSAAAEGAVNARDPQVGVAWPRTISSMSDRDQGHPLLPANFKGIEV